MHPKKTLAFAFLVAVLIILLVQVIPSGPTVKRMDDDGSTEAALGSAFGTTHRRHSNSRVRPSALGKRSTVIGIAHGQAGIGGGPLVTNELSEDLDAHDDEMISEEGMPQDRSIYPWEPSQQFWQWRKTFADEAPDRAWAEQLRGELTRRTEDRRRAAATFHQIDCRETICQMYVHADNAQDAQAAIATLSEDRLEAEHEQLAAHVQLEDAPKGGITYELVVRRDRPTSMPPHVAGAALAYSRAVEAREGIE